MEELGYDGVLWITAAPGDGPPHTRVVIERLDVGSADAPGSS